MDPVCFDAAVAGPNAALLSLPRESSRGEMRVVGVVVRRGLLLWDAARRSAAPIADPLRGSEDNVVAFSPPRILWSLEQWSGNSSGCSLAQLSRSSFFVSAAFVPNSARPMWVALSDARELLLLEVATDPDSSMLADGTPGSRHLRAECSVVASVVFDSLLPPSNSSSLSSLVDARCIAAPADATRVLCIVDDHAGRIFSVLLDSRRGASQPLLRAAVAPQKVFCTSEWTSGGVPRHLRGGLLSEDDLQRHSASGGMRRAHEMLATAPPSAYTPLVLRSTRSAGGAYDRYMGCIWRDTLPLRLNCGKSLERAKEGRRSSDPDGAASEAEVERELSDVVLEPSPSSSDGERESEEASEWSDSEEDADDHNDFASSADDACDAGVDGTLFTLTPLLFAASALLSVEAASCRRGALDLLPLRDFMSQGNAAGFESDLEAVASSDGDLLFVIAPEIIFVAACGAHHELSEALGAAQKMNILNFFEAAGSEKEFRERRELPAIDLQTDSSNRSFYIGQSGGLHLIAAPRIPCVLLVDVQQNSCRAVRFPDYFHDAESFVTGAVVPAAETAGGLCSVMLFSSTLGHHAALDIALFGEDECSVAKVVAQSPVVLPEHLHDAEGLPGWCDGISHTLVKCSAGATGGPPLVRAVEVSQGRIADCEVCAGSVALGLDSLVFRGAGDIIAFSSTIGDVAPLVLRASTVVEEEGECSVDTEPAGSAGGVHLESFANGWPLLSANRPEEGDSGECTWVAPTRIVDVAAVQLGSSDLHVVLRTDGLLGAEKVEQSSVNSGVRTGTLNLLESGEGMITCGAISILTEGCAGGKVVLVVCAAVQKETAERSVSSSANYSSSAMCITAFCDVDTGNDGHIALSITHRRIAAAREHSSSPISAVAIVVRCCEEEGKAPTESSVRHITSVFAAAPCDCSDGGTCSPELTSHTEAYDLECSLPTSEPPSTHTLQLRSLVTALHALPSDKGDETHYHILAGCADGFVEHLAVSRDAMRRLAVIRVGCAPVRCLCLLSACEPTLQWLCVCGERVFALSVSVAPAAHGGGALSATVVFLGGAPAGTSGNEEDKTSDGAADARDDERAAGSSEFRASIVAVMTLAGQSHILALSGSGDFATFTLTTRRAQAVRISRPIEMMSTPFWRSPVPARISELPLIGACHHGTVLIGTAGHRSDPLTGKASRSVTDAATVVACDLFVDPWAMGAPREFVDLPSHPASSSADPWAFSPPLHLPGHTGSCLYAIGKGSCVHLLCTAPSPDGLGFRSSVRHCTSWPADHGEPPAADARFDAFTSVDIVTPHYDSALDPQQLPHIPLALLAAVTQSRMVLLAVHTDACDGRLVGAAAAAAAAQLTLELVCSFEFSRAPFNAKLRRLLCGGDGEVTARFVGATTEVSEPRGQVAIGAIVRLESTSLNTSQPVDVALPDGIVISAS